ncbi:MAG: hypothetical protein LBF68_05870 [Christensenellaceae bacterium]|jgi:hypothetical protein|nr:hypothetical protein [Christensenellaceae bacterium]
MSKKRVVQERVIEEIEPTTLGLFFGSLFRLIFVSLKIFFFIFVKICKFFGLWLPIIYALFGLLLYVTTGFNPFRGDLYANIYITGFSLCIAFVIILTGRNLFFRPFRGISLGFSNPIWQRSKSDNKNPLYSEENTDEKSGDIAKTQPKAEETTIDPNLPPHANQSPYVNPYDMTGQNMQPMAYPYVVHNPMLYTQNPYPPYIPQYGAPVIMPQVPPIPNQASNAAMYGRSSNINQNIQDKTSQNYGTGRPNLSTFAMDISTPSSSSNQGNPNSSIQTGNTADKAPKIYFSKREPTLLVHEYEDRFETFRVVNGTPIKDKVEYK